MTALTTIVTVVTAVLVVYYLIYNLVYILLVVRAGAAITDQVAWPAELTQALTFANPLAPGVSVIVPAHN